MTTPYQAPDSNLQHKGMILCNACSKEIHSSAVTCPHCGVSRRKKRYKSKITTALFAFFLGGFGVHRFYLGQWRGILYLLFFWLLIPGFIALIECIYFLVSSSEEWDEKYNDGIPAGPNEKSSGALLAVLIITGSFFFISILGILAAIAIPAYQDYTVRAKVGEALMDVSPLRSNVEKYFNEHGKLPSSNSDIGIESPYTLSRMHNVVINSDGLVIVFRDNVQGFGSETLILTPMQEGSTITWSCKGGTLANRYRPSICRN